MKDNLEERKSPLFMKPYEKSFFLKPSVTFLCLCVNVTECIKKSTKFQRVLTSETTKIMEAISRRYSSRSDKP